MYLRTGRGQLVTPSNACIAALMWIGSVGQAAMTAVNSGSGIPPSFFCHCTRHCTRIHELT
jgi:hypothetical protein